MGALTSLIQPLTTLTSVIGLADNAYSGVRNFARDPYEDQRRILRAEQDLALKQLKEQQNAGEAQAARNAELQRQQMTTEAADAETRRRAALRRAAARQRAQFGASGIGNTGDGSTEAVLLGLFEETEEDRATRERIDTLRTAALNQDLEDRRALNVLQRAQLQERQKLERIASSY